MKNSQGQQLQDATHVVWRLRVVAPRGVAGSKQPGAAQGLVPALLGSRQKEPLKLDLWSQLSTCTPGFLPVPYRLLGKSVRMGCFVLCCKPAQPAWPADHRGASSR